MKELKTILLSRSSKLIAKEDRKYRHQIFYSTLARCYKSANKRQFKKAARFFSDEPEKAENSVTFRKEKEWSFSLR